MDTPCYLAEPSLPARGGLLVLPAWWGLTPFFKSLCDRLAGEGYLALALDLYHGKVAATVKEAERLRATLKKNILQEELRQAVTQLSVHPTLKGKKLGVVGFSLGAWWALWLVEDSSKWFSAVVLSMERAAVGTPVPRRPSRVILLKRTSTWRLRG
jgi:carboxymethylenebutenolidase